MSLGLLAQQGTPETSYRHTTAYFDPTGVDLVIRQALKAHQVPGVQVAVLERGRVVWYQSYGVARAFRPNQPVTDETIFEAASLSKPVFAYAVLRLAEEGMLDLDAPLADYMPVLYGTDERLKSITARMVLTHQSGFANWSSTTGQLAAVPGSSFKYSGEAFNYLRQVVEFLTKDSVEELVKRLVFDPLEMHHSSFVWQPDFEANHAHGHHYGVPTGYKAKPAKGNAAGSLHTTALDYARFLQVLLRPAGGCPACLSNQMLKDLLRQQVQVANRVGWSLGFGLQYPEEYSPCLWHWGHSQVFTAYFEVAPAEGTGVVVLTNSSAGLQVCKAITTALYPTPRPAFDWLGVK
jgi:CubicO group peptidase (beta-lactamase class C family)